jgi:hypothetical protein
LKFRKIAQLFFVSVSLVRENLSGMRGNLKQKNGPLPTHMIASYTPGNKVPDQILYPAKNVFAGL